MTRDEKFILVKMLGSGRRLEVDDHERALSRLMRAGLVVNKRWKTSVNFGRNRYLLTDQGRQLAARLAQKTEPSFNRLEWWRGVNRRSKLIGGYDGYGYRVHGKGR